MDVVALHVVLLTESHNFHKDSPLAIFIVILVRSVSVFNIIFWNILLFIENNSKLIQTVLNFLGKRQDNWQFSVEAEVEGDLLAEIFFAAMWNV